MSEHRPAFGVRKGNPPGLGWVVDILLPDGETEVIKGFTAKITGRRVGHDPPCPRRLCGDTKNRSPRQTLAANLNQPTGLRRAACDRLAMSDQCRAI
jgi:hypothetical protein